MPSPKVIGVVPARMGSSRLPGKALLPLQGKPLLFYVWNEALKSKSMSQVVVATDSREIARVAEGFGAEVVMTSAKPRNGTERTALVARKVSGEIYVNIQGDNYQYRSAWIDKAVKDLNTDRKRGYQTLATRISDDQELYDPDRVKVAIIGPKSNLYAGWFSRYPIPFLRDRKDSEPASGQFAYYKHIGIYLYRRKALEEYAHWKPGTIEKAESLEQMRVLENGAQMGITLVKGVHRTIESPADLE